MKNKSIEIMSPAGSWESLQAAIQGGANSVYFGIEQLNMRAKSSNNFTLDDLIEIASLCIKNNIKSYITLNTIIYDHDLILMQKIIDTAKKEGINAIIASDQAVIAYASSVQMKVHISTQINITNIETIRFYSNFADVIVLSRELSLRQIKNITNEIEKQQIKGPSGNLIQLEIFAHGALCVAVSGKCYMSLHTTNSSANRGACIQNCRKTYSVTDKEDGYQFDIDNEYIMSPKDLCTIGFLNQVLDSGPNILKIEGRGRSPEYVKTTTQCYREAADSYLNGSYTKDKIEGWITKLKTVYNRGFWDGYYLGQKLGEWTKTHGSKATKKKIYLGKAKKYFTNLQVAEFNIESFNLKKGDNILITGTTTGVIETIVDEMRNNDKLVTDVKKGDNFSMKLDYFIRPNDRLYKVVNAE
ncbi:MAG: U32 family peptidase [Pelagibacteraceae bacterium]|jgi:putative protease|nr:U32 family peptidase [Pelagibacteraceae bacterium]MBO6467902.1 U32 family peptidase [Pelagibacteraceae bacterium]MBO6471666.1 U32 family peptidase [Pelagibacteraceae bacterium]MBO6480015.1 U32 family peptidase [Pelagibacteraceae bacterium]